MGTVLVQLRASRIHSGSADLHCTNGPSKRVLFTLWWARMVGKQALMMILSHVASTTSGRGSSGECLLAGMDLLALGYQLNAHTNTASCMHVQIAKQNLVRKGGLEPPRVSPPDPKSGASANSATFARRCTIFA